MEDIWFNPSSWRPHSDIHLHWSTVKAEGDCPLLAWNVIAQQCELMVNNVHAYHAFKTTLYDIQTTAAWTDSNTKQALSTQHIYWQGAQTYER